MDGQEDGSKMKADKVVNSAVDFIEDTSSESSRHPAPIETDEGWLIPNPIGHRLWQKSAIGSRRDNGIIVQPCELLFCHWHRSISLPSDKWINQELVNNKEFLHESKALTAIRKSGEMLILMLDTEITKKYEAEDETWAVRWNRGEHPTKHPAISEMRWIRNDAEIEWRNLWKWIKSVRKKERLAEIMVIDEEFDVTSYRMDLQQPSGEFANIEIEGDIKNKINVAWNNRIKSGAGNWIDIDPTSWQLPQIGVNWDDGVWLNHIESNWIEWKLNKGSLLSATTLFNQLIESGLMLRPGFKYGCRWRLYSQNIGRQHAPWLLVPETEAPSDWNSACLAARLAAGVNKKWICGINEGERWSFVSLDRWAPGKD